MLLHDPYACCEGTRPADESPSLLGGEMSRRGFLWTAGRGAAAFAVLPALGGLRAFADGAPGPAKKLPARKGKRVLVPIFLRGGPDGLNMLVPYADPAYHAMRKTLAIPAPGKAEARRIDDTFALHPQLARWAPLMRAGRMAILPAVGYPGNNRSHFVEQDVWETASPSNRLEASGWIARWLAGHTGSGPIRAVSFGRVLPRILRGEVPAQAVARLEELKLDAPGRRDETLDALRKAYGAAGGDLLPRTGKETLAAIEVLGKLEPAKYRPANGAVYPTTALAGQMKQAAQLIKADVGCEVIELELGGWDTHQRQGGVIGTQARLMNELSGAVAAFLKDLGDAADEVLVVTLSEFGRTARENGTEGTDHGHANCQFVFGSHLGKAAAGKIAGRWPGIGKDQLHQNRDLAFTTDFRDLFADVLVEHLGCRDLSGILRGWKRTPAGLF